MTSPRRHRARRRDRRLPRWITFLGASILVHVLGVAVGLPLWPLLSRTSRVPDSRPVSLVLLEPSPPEPEPPPVPPEVRGQIVDLPPPQDPVRPKEADYLAEHDRTVERETRTERFQVNPEVLAPSYSKESKLQFEDLVDLGATEPSTGAKAGNDRFDPDRAGRLTALNSPFAVTNKDGLQRPVPSSHRDQALSGAPNNDYLQEEVGAAVNLNTHEFLYAGYLNRIRRLVSFYWQQNLDNLPGSLRLAKNRYETVVDVLLTEDGAVASVRISGESGAPAMDHCVVDAFQMAGPFPHPPEQLVGPDGMVRLPDFGFVVEVGHARANYVGVDPRAGVQFPGILKSRN